MHEEQPRTRRSLARRAVVVHRDRAPGPDLDLHDGQLGLGDGMTRAAGHVRPQERAAERSLAFARHGGTRSVERASSKERAELKNNQHPNVHTQPGKGP